MSWHTYGTAANKGGAEFPGRGYSLSTTQANSINRSNARNEAGGACTCNPCTCDPCTCNPCISSPHTNREPQSSSPAATLPSQPLYGGATLVHHTGELDQSFAVINNVHGHQIHDPNFVPTHPIANTQDPAELRHPNQTGPLVYHAERVIMRHTVISNVGGNQYGQPQPQVEATNRQFSDVSRPQLDPHYGPRGSNPNYPQNTPSNGRRYGGTHYDPHAQANAVPNARPSPHGPVPATSTRAQNIDARGGSFNNIVGNQSNQYHGARMG